VIQLNLVKNLVVIVTYWLLFLFFTKMILTWMTRLKSNDLKKFIIRVIGSWGRSSTGLDFKRTAWGRKYAGHCKMTTWKQPITCCRQAMPSHKGKLYPPLRRANVIWAVLLLYFTTLLLCNAILQWKEKIPNSQKHASMVSHCFLFLSSSTVH